MIEPTTDLVVRLPDHPSASLAYLRQEGNRYDEAAKSLNTRKAYELDWEAFQTWCDGQGRQSLPATTDTVCLYLTHMADTGFAVASIKRHLSSISKAHRLREHDNPTKSGAVETRLQGIKNTLGTAQIEKIPIVTPDLARLVSACETLPPLVAARDRALLLIGCAGGFRRAELIALNTADVVEKREGLIITVRKSKTDQTGHGEEVAIPYGSHMETCPVRSLQTWLSMSGISDGPLWRAIDRHGNLGIRHLSSDAVARIVKRTCERVGLDPALYSGHSMRSGMATSAAAGGAPERAIMRQGRWKSRAMVDRYVRHGTLWQECAAAYMGL